MTKKEEVTLREYFDLKFESINDKLVGMSGLMKDHYEQSCHRLNDLEIFKSDQLKVNEKINKQLAIPRWVQKNKVKAVIIAAIFIIFITNLSLIATIISQSGIFELIKLFK